MRPSSSWISGAVGGLALALALAVSLWWWWPQSLRPVTLVDDKAGLLSGEELERVSEFHAYLLKDYDVDYRVLSEPVAADINQLAVERFSELSAGMQSVTGRGLLLVIAPEERLVRLEVSQSLEPVYTDAFVRYIEERQMVPFFASGRLADGILATTELIVARLQDAEAQAALDPSPNATASAGGGAVARFETRPEVEQVGNRQVEAGRSPEATLNAYFEAMDQRNGSADLAIYTPETRAMLRRSIVTPAQMDMVVASYRGCVSEGVRTRGRYAVIRYRIPDRTCAPFFFEQGPDGWLLDLTMMRDAIRFGRSNAWRFDLTAEHPYEFAFEDWQFDRNGFPID